MKDNKIKRIIILPFISNFSSSAINEIEGLLIQGIEYKLVPLNAVNITDLKLKSNALNLKPSEGMYKFSDLKLFADKYNAKYALVAKYDDSADNIVTRLSFNLYFTDNLEVIDRWESPDGCFVVVSEKNYSINLDQFNSFINECANRLIDKLDIELDFVVKTFMDDNLITNIEGFKKLIKAKKQTHSYEDKIFCLMEAIDTAPGMDLSYYEMAKVLKSCKKYKDSINYYQIAINKSHSDCHKALYSNELGSCYALIKDHGNSIKSWENAIEFYPSYITPYINIALVYEEEGAFDKAEKYFLDIQRLSPSDCRPYFNLARLYSKTGEWLKAIEQYDNQLRNNPADAWSHSNIANCYLQLKKNKEAKSYFYKTIELDPDGEAGNYANQVIEALDEATKKDWWKFWKK